MNDLNKPKEQLVVELEALRAEVENLRQDNQELEAQLTNQIERQAQADQLLQRERLHRKTLFDGSVDGIVILDQAGNVMEANLSFANMLGYTPEETAALHMVDWEAKWTEVEIRQKLAASQPCINTFETRHRRKDGSIYDVEISSNGVSIDGEVVQFCICRDITSHKQTEAVLRSSEARFRQLFSDAPIGIALITSEESLIQVNQELCQMLDYGATELETLKVGDIIFLEDLEPYRLLAQQLFSQEIPHYRLENRLLKRNGVTVWVRLTATLLQEPNADTPYQLVMFEDKTQQRSIEQMKENFISVVSHEMRTPMTSIFGALGLLATGQAGTLTPEGQELTTLARGEAQRLMRLISDLLDLERLRSGHLTLVKTLCPVPELIAQSVNIVRSFANSASVTIEVSAVAQTIWADSDRIIQTLTNLINNAVKFSDSHQTIWVKAELMAEDREGINGAPDAVTSAVLFEVKDQGRGIPLHKLAAIFEPFEQVEIEDHRKGGSGLGLAICKNIVHEHGGQIWAASILGQGSSFFFTLPCGNFGRVPQA
jgi:PAS domain S-box-containing protein